MYRNFVFDIGNVLLKFKPLDYLGSKFTEKEITQNLYDQIFRAKEWSMLDEGTITIDEATRLFCSRNPEIEKQIKYVMEDWYSMLTPIEDSVSVLKKLKLKGYNAYALSNYHLVAFEKAYEEYDFFKLFDGLVISSRIKLLKPGEEIFKHLLSKYGIKPEETIFIDDTEENVKAAEKLGIKGIHLTCPSELSKNLKSLGVEL